MSEEIKLLRNGKDVLLANPGTKALKDFFILAKAMSKGDPDKPENFFENMDEKAMDSAINLVTITVKNTYPEFTKEDDAWATKNFMLILPKVIEMCSPKDITDDQERAEKIKAHINKE